jgi:acyl carrier protein phosphodiesterase
MNYLAHAYLSFGHPDILAGNMMSDFIKGNKKYALPKNIQNGITLHRLIDQYTDEHPATLAAKQLFKPKVGLYAGAFMDVVYDYFLANDLQVFPGLHQLKQFSETVYTTLQVYTPVFPQTFTPAFQHMQQNNWLLQYRSKEGIKRTFNGLVHRAQFLQAPIELLPILEKHRADFLDAYQHFFPDVVQFSSKQLAILLND